MGGGGGGGEEERESWFLLCKKHATTTPLSVLISMAIFCSKAGSSILPLPPPPVISSPLPPPSTHTHTSKMSPNISVNYTNSALRFFFSFLNNPKYQDPSELDVLRIIGKGVGGGGGGQVGGCSFYIQMNMEYEHKYICEHVSLEG